MKIREAVKKDVKEISEIFRKESNKKPYFQKWDKKTALEKIKKSLKEGDIRIVGIGEEIAGFIILKSDFKKKEVYIDELWLRSDYQGKGIGTTLINFIENEYKKKGINIIGVMVNQMAKAVNFYRKLKYKKKHAFYYMTKRLR